MSKRIEITEEQYQEAEKNGINRQLLRQRRRVNKMDIRKAVTQPVQPHSNRKKYLERALNNNISELSFNNRIYNLKWDYERACTEKVDSRYSVDRNQAVESEHKKNMVKIINEGAKMERIEVLFRISKLESERETASQNRSTYIDREILELGKQLIIPRRKNKIERLINKGIHLNMKDIEYLQSQEFTRKDIAGFMGMSLSVFENYLRNYRLKQRQVA